MALNSAKALNVNTYTLTDSCNLPVGCQNKLCNCPLKATMCTTCRTAMYVWMHVGTNTRHNPIIHRYIYMYVHTYVWMYTDKECTYIVQIIVPFLCSDIRTNTHTRYTHREQHTVLAGHAVASDHGALTSFSPEQAWFTADWMEGNSHSGPNRLRNPLCFSILHTWSAGGCLENVASTESGQVPHHGYQSYLTYICHVHWHASLSNHNKESLVSLADC